MLAKITGICYNKSVLIRLLFSICKGVIIRMERTYNKSFIQILVDWAKNFVLSEEKDEVTTVDDKAIAKILEQGQNEAEKLEETLKINKKKKEPEHEQSFPQVKKQDIKPITKNREVKIENQNKDDNERIK